MTYEEIAELDGIEVFECDPSWGANGGTLGRVLAVSSAGLEPEKKL